MFCVVFACRIGTTGRLFSLIRISSWISIDGHSWRKGSLSPHSTWWRMRTRSECEKYLFLSATRVISQLRVHYSEGGFFWLEEDNPRTSSSEGIIWWVPRSCSFLSRPRSAILISTMEDSRGSPSMRTNGYWLLRQECLHPDIPLCSTYLYFMSLATPLILLLFCLLFRVVLSGWRRIFKDWSPMTVSLSFSSCCFVVIVMISPHL